MPRREQESRSSKLGHGQTQFRWRAGEVERNAVPPTHTMGSCSSHPSTQVASRISSRSSLLGALAKSGTGRKGTKGAGLLSHHPATADADADADADPDADAHAGERAQASPLGRAATGKVHVGPGKLRVGRFVLQPQATGVLVDDTSHREQLSFASTTVSDDGFLVAIVSEAESSCLFATSARLVNSHLPSALRLRWTDERGYSSASVRKTHLRGLPGVVAEAIVDFAQDIVVEHVPEVLGGLGESAFALAAIWESTVSVASVGKARVVFHDAKGAVSELSNPNARDRSTADLFRGEPGLCSTVRVRIHREAKVLRLGAEEEPPCDPDVDTPDGEQGHWSPQFVGQVRCTVSTSTTRSPSGRRALRPLFLLIGSPSFFEVVPPLKACELCSARLAMEEDLVQKKTAAIAHLGADSVVTKSLLLYDANRANRAAQGLCNLAKLAGAQTASVIVVEWDF